MVRLHTSYRTIAALVLLGVTAVVCVSLGQWQLGRAAQRTEMRNAIEAGRAAAPLAVDAATPASALQQWRPASVRGEWRTDLTVLLENRNHQGNPGYWVATPLVLAGQQQAAMLVLRGWLPRFGGPGAPGGAAPARMPVVTAADVAAPAGEHTIRGELLSHVPRMFELASWAGGGSSLPARLPVADGALPIVQNLELADLASATGLKLMSAVLAQNAPEDTVAASGKQPVLVRDWPEPSLDADQNRGYALQWFSFAAIAAGAWILIAWRALRRARNP